MNRLCKKYLQLYKLYGLPPSPSADGYGRAGTPEEIEIVMKQSKSEKPFSWLTPIKDIVENEYILSANTYNPHSGEKEVNHRNPKDILMKIKQLDDETKAIFAEVNKII